MYSSRSVYRRNVEVEIKVTEGDLADLIETALIGDYGWFRSVSPKYNSDNRLVGFDVVAIDPDDSNALVDLSVDARELSRALIDWLEGGDYFTSSGSNYICNLVNDLMSEVDSDAADSILQVATFGEVVYG